MKIDQNHIDELFKERLDSYAEVPRQGVWKRISSRLLWKEIAHLNFTNVPALWTGLAAAGVLVASLFIFTPSIIDEEKPVTADKSENISQTDSPERLEKETTQTAEAAEERFAEDAHEQTGAQAEAESDNTPVTHQSKKTTEIHTRPDTRNPEQIAANAKQKLEIPDDITSDEPELSKQQSVKETQPSEQPVLEPESTALQSDSEIEEIEEQESRIEEPAALQDTDISTVEKVKPALIGQEVDASEILTETAGTIPVSDEQDHFMKEIDTDAESGKLQKMHSLSFSIGQFLKGKYKPPRRSYHQSTMQMYRGNNSYFSLSAYAAPEVTEYTRIASSSRESSYLGGLALSYHTSRYVFQGGLEVSYHNDLGDYMVNMSTWDSVGFYEGISGFEIDPDNPDSIILHTHTVVVYDSVEHHSHQQTRNHYTYLQFPLMVGYKAMESGIFSAYIKAGPSFSFLLQKQEPKLNFSMPDATIHGIDNYTAPRLNTSIQILVSLSMQFQVTEKIGILAEPTYRYYLNPVYDVNSDQLENPYSIGVRGGLYFNF